MFYLHHCKNGSKVYKFNDDLSILHERFSDVIKEPKKLLLTIDGYQDSALLPLEEAIKPIQHLIDSDI
jgi:hypothetical protein